MKSIKFKSRLGVVAALVALAVSVTAGAAVAGNRSGPEPRQQKRNLVETAVAAGSFKTLVSLVKQAGLADTLATGGRFTVFAPTDAAFAKLPKKTLAGLGANPAKLRAVLLYHVAKGKLRAQRAVKRSSIRTLNGASLRIRARGKSVKVNKAKVLKADVHASNGVIHVINRVLIPPAR